MTAANRGYVHRTSRDLARRGMRIREVVTVGPGSLIFRFVDSATAAFAQDRLCRNWWWSRREVLETFREARNADRAVSDVVRTNGAIIDQFRNRCGALIVAKARVELTAFSGPGVAVDDEGALHGRTTDGTGGGGLGIPAPGYDQLFIPGLEEPRHSAQWLEFQRAVATAYASTLMRGGESPSVLVQSYSHVRGRA